MPLPRAVLDHTRRHLGLVTRSWLRDLGIPGSTIDSWVAVAKLEVVQWGVYRLAGSVVPAAQHILAAVLRAGSGARASGWSACALYGMEGFDLGRPAWVVVPHARRVRGVDFIVRRSTLDRGDLATVAGVPAVTPVRAVIDAGGEVPDLHVRVGIDDARRRGLFALVRLLDRAVELGNHRGAVAIRRLFGSGLLDQDGELERRLALALEVVGLHPVWGMEVVPGIIADACFPEASLVVECDGRRWHTIDSDRAADISRTAVLLADGWHVDRVTSVDLADGGASVAARIVRLRASRIAAGLGRPPTWRPVAPGRRLRPPAVSRTR